MRRERRPISALALWAKLNNVELHDTTIVDQDDGRGARVVASSALKGYGNRIMTIPRELSLSKNLVWEYAKVDRHLREVLQAFGDFTLHARGAILVFLLLQMTANSPDIPLKIGVSTPWSEYFGFLPVPKNLPVFWTDDERETLAGTTLQAATNAKMSSLGREFEQLREVTKAIDWCAKYWWDSEKGCLTLDDWKTVDAMYRSRAMELPIIGHCMVPVLDMCNHDSTPLGHYNVDGHGNGVLLLDSHREISPESEVTICYGENKGACEMLFSYGFLEESMKNAKSMFLPFEIPDDDPLKFAKQSVFDGVSGFRIYDAGQIKWAGSCVWLACVNEEDGLGFAMAQTTDGQMELQATWKGTTLENPDQLSRLLTRGLMWDVFRLRATSLIHQHVEAEIARRLGIPKGQGFEESDVEKALAELSEKAGSEDQNQGSNVESQDSSRDVATSHSLATDDDHISYTAARSTTCPGLGSPDTINSDVYQTGLATGLANSKIAPTTDEKYPKPQAAYAMVKNGKRIKIDGSIKDSAIELSAVQDEGSKLAERSDDGSEEYLALGGNTSKVASDAYSLNHTPPLEHKETTPHIDDFASSPCSEKLHDSQPPISISIIPTTIRYIQKLKHLELALLHQAREQLTDTISTLATSDNVQRYLAGDEKYLEELILPPTRSSSPCEQTEQPSSSMEVPTWDTQQMQQMEGSTEAVEQHRRRTQTNEAWQADDYW